MHLKRFEGASMREVLREVRETLGPDALVVSTRTVRRHRSLFGRLGGSVIEVTAAVDRAPGVESVAEQHQPEASWNDLRMTRALVSPLEAEIRALRSAVERLSARSEPAVDLTRDLQALREVARERKAGCGPRPARGEPVDALAARLDAALRPPRPDENAAILYVGPPGAGKTTTLAKVAARTESFRDDLAVVTTDCHRLGADASLRAFAKQLGVPFEAAVSPGQLAQAVAKRGRRPMLIDTAGRSRRDTTALTELRMLRDALGARARVCLVLPANGREIDLRADVARYRELEPDALVLTKVDESVGLDDAASLLLGGDCPPLHWIATGQRVPEDLFVADPRDLAERILGAAA